MAVAAAFINFSSGRRMILHERMMMGDFGFDLVGMVCDCFWEAVKKSLLYHSSIQLNINIPIKLFYHATLLV